MGIGRLYFAAVADNEVFNTGVHLVEDLQVFNVKISQSEGEFARAELEVTNPREGLLLDTRKQRLFISCEESPGGPIVLLFSGRITGFPLDLDDEIVTLEYIAQPEGWQTTQQTFLDTLKVAPYYNELFIPVEDRDLPEEILAARSTLLHWNRATGAISISDILQGSQTIDIGGDFFFDSLNTAISDPPLRAANLSIEVQWEQFGVGEVNVGEAVRQGFINTTGPTPQINTLTPNSFIQGWEGVLAPKGYEIIENRITPVANSLGVSEDVMRSAPASVDGTIYRTAQGFDTGGNRACTVPRVWFRGKMRLLATYKQKRVERFEVPLISQTQSYTLAGETEENIFLRLQDPVSAANGSVLDPTQPSFFVDLGLGQLTPHGQTVFEHGLLRARARLAKAMRAVESTFEVALDQVLSISCDHSIRIEDDRLPGTEVFGKVLGYQLEVDGDTGKQLATITIGSAIGLGFDSVGPLGSTQFAAVVYNTVNAPGTMTSAIYYSDLAQNVSTPIDVGSMESNELYLIDNVLVQNSGNSQNIGFAASATPDTYLEANKTRVVVDLKSMNPAPVLEALVTFAMQYITWPKQIDLGTTIYNLTTEAGEQLTTEAGDFIVV